MENWTDKALVSERLFKNRGLNHYAFIDWVLTLPKALEKIFLEDLREYEKEKKMPYITSAERDGPFNAQKIRWSTQGKG